MKNKLIPLAGIVAMLTLGVLVSAGVFFGSPTQAAPPAAPTPVADFLVPAGQPTTISFQTATALAADTNTSGIEVMRLGAVDMQYIIDHVGSGEVNTTTLKIQYSNDNSNWVDGLTLVSASAADGTTITRVPVFGRYMRVNQDVTNAVAITITLTAVGK